MEICEERVLEVLDAHLELVGHLLVGRRALQLVLELLVGALDLAGAGAHRARHPVQRAQLVDDRALDARDRVGLELDLALGLEALDRADQADEAVGDEVGLLDVRGQPGRHAAGDVLDQRRVGDDEPLARPLVPVRLVAAPEVAELDRLDVRFPCPPVLLRPADGCARRRCAGAPTLPECRSGSSRCCVPEQLLDRAQVGAAVQQVRREASGAGRAARRRPAAPPPAPRRAGGAGTSEVERRRPVFERNSAGSPAVGAERRAAPRSR